MSTLTLIGTPTVILILCWAVWFAIGLIRYILNDEAEIDKRLRDVSR